MKVPFQGNQTGREVDQLLFFGRSPCSHGLYLNHFQERSEIGTNHFCYLLEICATAVPVSLPGGHTGFIAPDEGQQ
jgi:hypothetical protein